LWHSGGGNQGRFYINHAWSICLWNCTNISSL